MGHTHAGEALRREYARWLTLSDRERRRNKLPLSHGQFAEWKSVSDRTLRRWRTEPAFLELLVEAQGDTERRREGAAVAVAVPDAVPPPDGLPPGELASQAEAEYRRVRATLAQMASDGTPDAMRLYMQYYGGEFARAEAEENQDLRGMSDEQLVGELVRAAGLERVASVLAGAAR